MYGARHAAYRGRAHIGRAVARQHCCEYRQLDRGDRDGADLDDAGRALAFRARARIAVVGLSGCGAAHQRLFGADLGAVPGAVVAAGVRESRIVSLQRSAALVLVRVIRRDRADRLRHPGDDLWALWRLPGLSGATLPLPD